ncbi:DegT/DnrJ/EryC1/StrS family aminotransferase [Paracoccaceae bacterium]|nr:DegT/DnrJ/EryC1/StrS family aminotransferase [Paracoccaceae bacterium]
MSLKFPLASSTWGKEEIRAMQIVIDSGMFTMGENVLSFENAFANYIGSKYCVMVNSGSSANLLMVAALFYTKSSSLKRGDEVIVPAVSWATTYFPLYQYGLKLKFVDIDLETLNYDIEQLESAIGEKTKLIMAVNLLGNPNNFLEINKMINGSDIILIEDNCESMGAQFNEQYAGTFGKMGSFSTFFSHHMSTMEGGHIVTDDEELYHILLSLRAHGWTRNLPIDNQVCKKNENDSFMESFRFVLPGYNVRPLELEGAIGVEQLKKLPEFIKQRRSNGKLFQEIMDGHPTLMIQKEIGLSSWFGFSLIIRQGVKLTRQNLISRLTELGFESRPIVAGNFTGSNVMKYFNYEVPFKLRNAEYLDANGLFIGNHHFPMDEALEEIVNL